LKLGGGQFVAPPVFGETSVPGTLASFAGFPIGCPFALISFVQFAESMTFDVTMCWPLVRSEQHVVTVAVRLRHELPRAAIDDAVDEHRRLRRVQSCVSCGVT